VGFRVPEKIFSPKAAQNRGFWQICDNFEDFLQKTVDKPGFCGIVVTTG